MEEREYRPQVLSRQGERTAWLLALAAGLGVLMLGIAWRVPGWAWAFWAFLLASAASISLGNWMDRRTVIRVRPDGIRYQNGLRDVDLPWPEIQKVSRAPARFGHTVQVVGPRAHFAFKTFAEVRFQGEVRGSTGFADGERILETIVERSALQLVERSPGGETYARG